MKQSLNTDWLVKRTGAGAPLETNLPASVYSVLIDRGMLNPYFGENQYSACELSMNDYVFSKEFVADEVIMRCDVIKLRFNGLDTVAEIRLNGRIIGNADNMHRIWEYDVKQQLLQGRNVLEVVLYSPIRYIREKNEKRRLWGVSSTMEGYPHLRKAHYMFGWDWGPQLPDMGIWRDVELLGFSKARIDGIYVRQQHENGRVMLSVEAQTEVFSECSQEIKMIISSPDGDEILLSSRIYSDRTVIEAVVENPKLWNVRGYGEQNIYSLYAELYDGAELLDCTALSFGLRTVTVSRKHDEYGDEFAFVVNGIKIFAMGANYIPEDQIIPHTSKERTRRLLEDCAKANFNCIRVWGGGYYPDNYFYEQCDRLGLLVWQDFMYACSVYYLSREFYKNIKCEAIDNIKRLRNFACIGMWCGNNEIESAWQYWGLPEDRELKEQYLVQFEILIPSVLKTYDPDRFYWPSSPSSGGGFNDSGNNNRGDSHYWAVWHGMKPFTDFRKHFFRFCSEFGFESLPSIKTIRSFTDEKKLNLTSPVMEAHQKCEAGNEKLLYYIAQMVHYPCSFEALIYASQLVQAEAIRMCVEHLRRNRGRCMGSIYWQVNDSNPVISWSGIDYYGRWKALHYYTRRFYSPVLLSVDSTDVKKTAFSISNERLTAAEGQIKWRVKSNKNELIAQGVIEASVPALSAVIAAEVDFSRYLSDSTALRSRYIEYSFVESGVRTSGGTAMYVLPKSFIFENPRIAVSVSEIGNKYKLCLTAEAFAKGVELDFEDVDCVFGDNWFDMCSEELFVVIDKSRLPESMTAADVGARLKIRSYYNLTE